VQVPITDAALGVLDEKPLLAEVHDLSESRLLQPPPEPYALGDVPQ
jgi:hypothetical protein